MLLTALPCALAIAQKDAKAKQTLEKSEKAFRDAGAMTAKFTLFLTEKGSNEAVSFDGTLSIKGNKFKIEAPDYIIWFDGQTQWALSRATGEVNITEPSAEEVQTLNPSMIYDLYKKNCDCRFIGEKTDAQMRPVSEIELKPKNKNLEISKIVIQISQRDLLPAFLHVEFAKNNVENNISINKYDLNLTLPDELFVFDPKAYPEADVIDLR
jgi:outer membrane lipoprotein-sorting protein